MSRFDICLSFVLKREGGYCDHPSDRGGPTTSGITQAVFDDYRTRAGRSRVPVSGIGADEIAAIYKLRYWAPVCGDLLGADLDLVVFDAAVNHGVKQASKFLQRALGVDADGIIGKHTIAAVAKDRDSGMIPHVIGDIIDQRRDFYEALAQRNPTQRVFLRGWFNRLDHVIAEVTRHGH